MQLHPIFMFSIDIFDPFVLIGGFLLGVLVGILIMLYINSRTKYSGTIRVDKHEGKTIFSLELDHDPEELEDRKQVAFKVESGNGKPG